MTIREFYELCISMQSKTSIRVYDYGSCIYTGSYADLPWTIMNHEISNCSVNPNMEWKFYFNS